MNTITKTPVIISLNVQPLLHHNKPIGATIMDDRPVQVNLPRYGQMALNVNRTHYCDKIKDSQLTILEEMQDWGLPLLPTERLVRFMETVSDRIVFKHKGTTYRVFLKRNKYRFDLESVVPYWATVCTGGIGTPSTKGGTQTFKTASWNGGINWWAQKKKFGRKAGRGVDLKETFGFQ